MDEQPFDSQNAAYAQSLYEEFARNPEGVPQQWRDFFSLGPAATVEAGLIVLGPHAKHGLLDFDNTVRAVLAHSVCPVWVQPGEPSTSHRARHWASLVIEGASHCSLPRQA